MTTYAPPPTTLPIEPTTSPLQDLVERGDALDFRRHQLWFPHVDLPRIMGHAQGIGLLTGDDCSALYVSVSDFPKGWGAMLINTNRHHLDPDHPFPECNALALPQSHHPGGIAIDSERRLLIVPFEARHKDAWLGFFDLSDPLYPRQVDFLPLTAPVTSSRRDHLVRSNPAKASACAIATMTAAGRRPVHQIVVLSENRFLRVITEADGGRPEQVASFDARDPNLWNGRVAWPSSIVDDIGLVVDGEQLYLVAFAHDLIDGHGLGLPVLDRLELVRTVPGWGDDVVHIIRFDPDSETPFTAHRSFDTNLKMANVDGGIEDIWRPSFRWGAGVHLVDGELGIMAVERIGSQASPNGLVRYLDFVSSHTRLAWPVA